MIYRMNTNGVRHGRADIRQALWLLAAYLIKEAEMKAARKDIHAFLVFLAENQPITLKEARDAGYNQLAHATTAKRLLETGVIEKYKGINPDSHVSYARVAVAQYRIGPNPYTRPPSAKAGKPSNTDAARILRARMFLESKGYAVALSSEENK